MMSDFRGGGGGQAKLGQNRTRGIGRGAKIGHPIFQEFLPPFSSFFSVEFLKVSIYSYFCSLTPLLILSRENACSLK